MHLKTTIQKKNSIFKSVSLMYASKNYIQIDNNLEDSSGCITEIYSLKNELTSLF